MNGKTERVDVENPNPGQRPGDNVSKLSFKKLQNYIFSKKSPCFHRLFFNKLVVIYMYFLF
ncbi:hypothetical protein FDC35_12735 [Clostridium botulinum]|nr:hypothetical protein [Clostridium botulinum]NFP01727.1 hypothetical protein [Clostridium botulinum]